MEGQASDRPGEQHDLLTDPVRLAAANINPVTGLSTDYLNHFSEAIMLLDFVLHIPECRDDLARWRPRSYREHFAASDLRHRDLALAAYNSVEEQTRRQFDATCEALNIMILSTRAALRAELPEPVVLRVVTDAMAKLKPLFARASAIIHGRDPADADAAETPDFAALASFVAAS